MSEFHAVDDGLHLLRESLSPFGFEIGRTAAVVDLPDGGVLVHSPPELTEERRRWFDDRGGVRAVVPASKVHGHLWTEEYRDAFPDAELWAAPGLDKRRTDLAFDGLLGSAPEPGWADVLDQEAALGHRFGTEIEFLHRPSGTLLLGDLCYNVGDRWPPQTRLVARARGVRGGLAVPREFRASVTNPEAMRASVERILDWEFDRVVVGHGDVVWSDGKAAFRNAFDWLLE